MRKKISDKDKKDWENFINGSEKLEIKDIINSPENFKNAKTIDLHGYTLSDANYAIQELINRSYNLGIKKITVITGKGLRSKNYNDPYKSENLGILKYSVPEFIKKSFELMKKVKKITYVDIENRNKGSFSIYLKSKK